MKSFRLDKSDDSPLNKPPTIIAGIIIGAIAIWITVASYSGGDTPDPTAVAAPAPEPAPANITLVADKSLCLADPSTAKIHFFITVRNDDTINGTVNARPWRRYSDNEVNESIIDTLTMEVPAGAVRKFNAEFGYNAETHSLLECGLFMGAETEPTMIAVG